MYRLRTTPIIALAFSLALASAASAQVQTGGQQACAAAVDKEYLKTVKALSADMNGCLKSISKGTASVSCFGSDSKGKIKAAKAKLLVSYAASCVGNRPDFGFGGLPNVLDAAGHTETASLATLFGSNLSAALPIGPADLAIPKCQQAVAKAVTKCIDTQLKGFAKCKAAALRDGATAASAVADCFGADTKIASACDLSSGTSVDGIRKAIAKSCTLSNVNLVAAFPGCSTADPEQLHACAADGTLCMSCQQAALTSATEGSIDCDDYDNQGADGSCLSIFPTNASLASDAEPDETPGSPGVVETSTALIEQFGSASFDLNQSHYTRWRLTGPEQQPDAILIAIAGFGGDANNFQIMAEDLLPKMYLENNLVVEIWGLRRDRRRPGIVRTGPRPSAIR